MSARRLTLVLLAVAAASPPLSRASGPWFDEAPPTLPFYLHRLPAKTVTQLAAESDPRPADERFIDYQSELNSIASAVATQAPGSFVAKVDELLTAARRANWRESRGWSGGPALANILHDIRDLLSATPPASGSQMADYIRWRIENAEPFGVIDRKESWQWEQPAPGPEITAEVERRLKSAPAALRPHWLYLRGALLLRNRDDVTSQQAFERVVADNPKHPRAEAALFMAARCQLSRSRGSDYTQRDPVLVDDQIPRAKQLFQTYLKKYPKGRFAGDAIGWLGALAFDQRDLTGALKYYTEQAELADHPELRPAALEMCEKTLSRIASAPEDAAIQEVARHPREATALLYLIVNSTESDNFNGEFDKVETVKEWKKKILPQLARAVAAQKQLYQQTAWKPRYLAVLAQAASGDGNQKQALELVAMGGAEIEKSDDLLFARAVAAQRSGRLLDAIKDYRALISTFRKSPLAPGARLRVALALQDDHQAGEAILELAKLSEANTAAKAAGEAAEEEIDIENTLPADTTNTEPAQIEQLIDTLLNFAPLAELEAPLQKADLDQLLRLRFSQAIAQRYLAREDFANARKFMTPAEFGLRAEGIEKLTREAAQAANPGDRAQKFLQLGDAWAAARKELLNVPLDTRETRDKIFAGEGSSAGLFRRENGKALLAAADLDAELEGREELRHASVYWLKAADAQPGSETAAAALWRALKAIPMIADVSAYSLSRAQETGAAAASKSLYERLRRECPNSREAREFAVYWSFGTKAKAKDGSAEGNEEEEEETSGSRDYFDGSIHDSSFASELVTAMKIGGEESGSGTYTDWEPVLASIRALEKDAGSLAPAKFTETVRRLQEEVRRQFRHNTDAPLLNFADDLVLFAERPNVAPAARAKYVQLRTEALRQGAIHASWSLSTPSNSEPDGIDKDDVLREKIAEALKDPAMRPVTDFLQFLDAAVVANDLVPVPIEGLDKDGEPYTYSSRDYKLLEDLTARFLAAHPKSPKHEAAALLHARAVFLLSRPVFYKNWVDWPTSDRWDGGFPAVYHQREPFQPERVLTALNGYLKPYGSGRYFPELRNYRADVAARMRDWDRALDLTVAQATDAAHPELYEDAARRLADIFAQLANEEIRATLLAAIKTRPDAVKMLAGFLTLDRDDHPLLYLRQYLADQLGFEFPAAPPAN